MRKKCGVNMKKYIFSKSIGVFTIILFFVLIYFFINTFNIFTVKEVQAYSNLNEVSILNNKYPLKIYNILNSNTIDSIKEEMIVEEIDLEYTTKYINNENLPNGTIHVTQIGEDGRQEFIKIKKYNNDILESEKIVASNIKKGAINKIVEIGIGKGVNNYELVEGDIVYITSNTLSVMKEPNKDGEKITTLFQGDSVIVKEVCENDWCYIESNNRKGYVLTEALSNINPNNILINDNSFNELDRDSLLFFLSYDMDLSKPSGLSLNQFRKILQYDENDKNRIFTDNCDYFYYAEQEYGINGIFLAAVAIHESGWGSSKISKEKNNLFGYMAYDSSPYDSAQYFESYAEGIDLLARVFVKYYLNEKGIEVYDGNIAEGKYYQGNTLKDVNSYYASDDNWSHAVFEIMKKLYGKL